MMGFALPQNQNCRKAEKTLVLSSGPSTGVTEGICLSLYTCAPLWRETMVTEEEDNVPNTQPRIKINATCICQFFSSLSEQHANYSEEALCSEADFIVGHPTSSLPPT